MTWQIVSDAMGADESLRPRGSTRLREHDEADFESESKEKMNDNEFEFKSDKDHVLEEYEEK